MNKYYMIPNNKLLDIFKEEIILPLKDFSIGFDVYFDVNEIKEASSSRIVNVIINRFMHKNDLEKIKKVIDDLNEYVNLFFVEDIGLTGFIPNDKIVLFQNHIVNNFSSVNYFKELGFDKIVINNDLTIDEIIEIREKSSSQLYLFSISKNALMYSRRLLLSSYYDYKKGEGEKVKLITESVSKKPLLVKEEEKGTVIFNDKIFSLNKYLNVLNGFNFIINLNNMNQEETKIVLNHYKDINMSDYIKIDDYFLDNKIIYKVGDK